MDTLTDLAKDCTKIDNHMLNFKIAYDVLFKEVIIMNSSHQLNNFNAGGPDCFIECESRLNS